MVLCKKIFMGFISIFITGASLAQVPVIDLNKQRQQYGSTHQAQTQPAPTYPTPGYRDDMYAQPSYSSDDDIRILRQQINAFTQLDLPGKVDALQQQIQELSGRLEVQAHQIETLTEQQKSFYQDLNQRLINMQTVGAAGSIEISQGILEAQNKVAQTGAVTADKSADAKPVVAPAIVDAEEKSYQAAFSLLIKKQNKEAIDAFNALLSEYPDGKNAASANYWLGELYSGENQNDLAAKHLNTLIAKYPNNDKVPDAMLKLAIIDDNNGQQEKAQQALRQIIEKHPDSSAARLANMRLQQMMNTI